MICSVCVEQLWSDRVIPIYGVNSSGEEIIQVGWAHSHHFMNQEAGND